MQRKTIGGSSGIFAEVQLKQTCFVWCFLLFVLREMLYTLFSKSKAAGVSGVQEEVCNLYQEQLMDVCCKGPC